MCVGCWIKSKCHIGEKFNFEKYINTTAGQHRDDDRRPTTDGKKIRVFIVNRCASMVSSFLHWLFFFCSVSVHFRQSKNKILENKHNLWFTLVGPRVHHLYAFRYIANKCRKWIYKFGLSSTENKQHENIYYKNIFQNILQRKMWNVKALTQTHRHTKWSLTIIER